MPTFDREFDGPSDRVTYPVKTTHHMCLDVRGVLTNWKARDLAGMFVKPDGTRSTADETRDLLLDEVAKGRKVIPIGAPCDGFDYQTGCPGHTEARR